MAAIPRVKGRLSDQAVNAGFGPAPTECVVAAKVNGRTLDAGHVTIRYLDQVCLPAPPFRPAQVHTKKHFRPVLCFGAPGTRLDIQVAGTVIHLAGKHSLKLQALDFLRDHVEVCNDGFKGLLIVLLDGHLQQAGIIIQTCSDMVQGRDNSPEC